MKIDKEPFEAKFTILSNKAYNKLKVNFVRIRSIYDEYTTAFSFCFALYKYIKAGCSLPQKAKAEMSSNASFVRSISKSTIKLSFSSSDLLENRAMPLLLSLFIPQLYYFL